MQRKWRQYSDLPQHIKEPHNLSYCLNFLKNYNLKAETLFHTRSNLLCLVVSFLFASNFSLLEKMMCTVRVALFVGLSNSNYGGWGFAKGQLPIEISQCDFIYHKCDFNPQFNYLLFYCYCI